MRRRHEQVLSKLKHLVVPSRRGLGSGTAYAAVSSWLHKETVSTFETLESVECMRTLASFSMG